MKPSKSENPAAKIEVTLDRESMAKLEACAKWRNMALSDLVRAYVEDWIAVEYPESLGRHSRRSVYRDAPASLSQAESPAKRS